MSRPTQKKYQTKRMADDFYSAEIKLSNFSIVYRFKLRDVDVKGASFLINENSAILKRLKVGMMLEMRYWAAEETKSVEFVMAKIKQIEKYNKAPSKENYLIRLEFQSGSGPEPAKQKKEALRSPKTSKDNGGRRKNPDRRGPSEKDYSPDRRSGHDRRSGTDRRSGFDRRSARQLRTGKSKKAKN